MKTYGGVFSTLTLIGGDCSDSRPGRSIPSERNSDTRWVGGCVDENLLSQEVLYSMELVIQPEETWEVSVETASNRSEIRNNYIYKSETLPLNYPARYDGL
jgi:hypothetical protein